MLELLSLKTPFELMVAPNGARLTKLDHPKLPILINEISDRFGNQVLVLSVDARRAKTKSGLAQNAIEADYSLYKMYSDIVVPLIDYDENGEIKTSVFSEQQTADAVLKILGYQNK